MSSSWEFDLIWLPNWLRLSPFIVFRTSILCQTPKTPTPPSYDICPTYQVTDRFLFRFLFFVENSESTKTHAIPKSHVLATSKIWNLEEERQMKWVFIYSAILKICWEFQTNRFSKAVPPSHLKGQPISARPHFRYRGIPKIIIWTFHNKTITLFHPAN